MKKDPTTMRKKDQKRLQIGIESAVAQILKECGPIIATEPEHSVLFVGAILEVSRPRRPAESSLDKPADGFRVVLSKKIGKTSVTPKAFVKPMAKLMRHGSRRKIAMQRNSPLVFVEALPASAAGRVAKLINRYPFTTKAERLEFLEKFFCHCLHSQDLADLFWRHFHEERSSTSHESLMMHRPIPDGSILTEPATGATFRTLEASTAHGAPLVEIITPGITDYKPGDRTVRTLYVHNGGHRIQSVPSRRPPNSRP